MIDRDRLRPSSRTVLVVLAGVMLLAAAFGIVRVVDVHYLPNAGQPPVDVDGDPSEAVVDATQHFETTSFRAETTVEIVDVTTLNASGGAGDRPPSTAIPPDGVVANYSRTLDYRHRRVSFEVCQFSDPVKNESLRLVRFNRPGLPGLLEAVTLSDGDIDWAPVCGRAYLSDVWVFVGTRTGTTGDYDFGLASGKPENAVFREYARQFSPSFLDPDQPWQVRSRTADNVTFVLTDPAEYYEARRLSHFVNVQRLYDASRVAVTINRETGHVVRVVDHRVVTVRDEKLADDYEEPNQVLEQRVHYRIVTEFTYGATTGPPAGTPRQRLEQWIADLLRY